MTRRKQSQGKCAFCGRQMTKSGLTKHLKTCPQRKEAIDKANLGSEKEQPLYHLQIQDVWGGWYWLHIEMRGSATLQDLDHYLRAIWLECCGHLSQFSIGGWSGDEIDMEKKISQVFKPDIVLTHIYDFGTSSETLVKAVDMRKGKPLTQHPIYLMARNAPPDIPCSECEKPARWLCEECAYETDESLAFCDEHAEQHEHYEEGLVEIVNSPRMGMCGYCGPAEPPY